MHTALQYQQHLKRSLSLFDVVIMTISTMSPIAGVFITIPLVLKTIGGLSWISVVLAGIIALIICIIYAELAATYPIAGGEYTWIARLLGNPLGFALMCLILVQGAFGCSVLPLGIQASLHAIWEPLGSTPVIMLFIILCVGAACMKVRTAAWITGVFVLLEIAVVSMVIILGFTHIQHFSSAFTPPDTAKGHTHISAIISILGVLSTIPMAFSGFAGYTSPIYYAEEIIDFPQKIAKIMAISTIIIMLESSIACIVIVAHFTSLTALMASADPVQYFLSAVSQPLIVKLMNIAVVIAIFNALIMATIQFGRVIYSTARDKTWLEPINRILSYIEPHTGNPINATILFGIILIIITLLVPLHIQLITLGSGNLIVAIITLITSLRLRQPGARLSAGFIMPRWPILPVSMIVILSVIVISSITQQTVSLLVTAVIIALGICYYYIYLHSRKQTHWNLLEPIVENQDS